MRGVYSGGWWRNLSAACSLHGYTSKSPRREPAQLPTPYQPPAHRRPRRRFLELPVPAGNLALECSHIEHRDRAEPHPWFDQSTKPSPFVDIA